jgi:hypothetical protein
VGHQVHPLEGQTVEQASDIGEVASEAIQRLDHDDLEPAGTGHPR